MRREWRSYLLVAVQFACLVALLLSGPLFVQPGALLVLELAGFGLGLWALVSMGSRSLHAWPDIKRGACLVTHGPYRLIRHPMYTALLLVTLTWILDSWTMWRFTIWLILLGDLLVKLRVEEKLLARHYDEYPAYQRRTYRLLPFIF